VNQYLKTQVCEKVTLSSSPTFIILLDKLLKMEFKSNKWYNFGWKLGRKAAKEKEKHHKEHQHVIEVLMDLYQCLRRNRSGGNCLDIPLCKEYNIDYMRLPPTLPDMSDSSQDEAVFFRPLTLKLLDKYQIDLEDKNTALQMKAHTELLPKWFQSSGINPRAIYLHTDAETLCQTMENEFRTIMRKGSSDETSKSLLWFTKWIHG
jgi:hypothetical protein